MADDTNQNLHVLVFPYPAQGHMLALLDLVRRLVVRGLSVTILVTPNNLPILASLVSTHPDRIRTLVLPFPDHPSIPPGIEHVKDLGNSGNSLVIGALSKLRDQIIHWFRTHPSPPIAIISDFFLGWTQEVATQIGIPRVAFYSGGAILACILHHIWKGFDSIRYLDVVRFPELPRSPSFIAEHLPSVFRRYRESDPDWEVVRSGMVANSSSWGVVLNTFDSLEDEYVQEYKRIIGHERVFAVGPVNLLDGPSDVTGNRDSDDVLSWLDGCREGSVLYVCFGSQKSLTKAQMEALASGLERSGVKFVWVVKQAQGRELEEGYGSAPEGFEGRVKGRGLVIRGWAPQVSILSHRAVGAFLSHCGWNSILEATIAGVVILGWPMEADQYINARLLVDYTGAAIRVCEGGDTVPDPIKLAQDFAKAMEDDIVQKVKTKELRDKALEAINVDGSSTKDLEGFINELGKLTG